MSSVNEKIEIVNEIVYKELDKILKKLNRRYYLKAYTVVIDNEGNYKNLFRIKKTISEKEELDNPKYSSDVIQEELKDLHNIFQELDIDKGNDIDNKFKNELNDFPQKIKEYLDKREYIDEFDNKNIDNCEIVQDIKCSELLYSNSFKLEIDSNTYGIIYILEIRNLDEETIKIFYENPSYSFLRIVLDCFFTDYFLKNNNEDLELGIDKKIDKKYNENSISFIRRISRVFFGKVQSVIKKEDSIIMEDFTKFDNEIKNEYYINNLIEEIDDISSKTYEGSSPFGSILFLNRQCLEGDNSKIDYTIEFSKEDRIKLDDCKRIRKLLEVTNEEENLYLISDSFQILGLGKVRWNELDDCILFRLDFKGLSKYNLNCVYAQEKQYIDGKLIIEDDNMIYSCDKKIKIVDDKLLTIVFKNPKIKEEEYTTEKFKRIIKSQFFETVDDENTLYKECVEKLDKILKKARDQKHGTMVVITDSETATSELKLLKKQSTLIETTEIDPKYIKHLTSIDGAIYFDIRGNCYAIGVILDGKAKEDIGDASRGARYNSAYRYLEKLKDNGQKCVISIISEDGMAEIIPEIEDEERTFSIAQEIINLISEEEGKECDRLKKILDELSLYENIDSHLYLKIGEAFYNKEKYEKAIEYFDKAFNKQENSFIISKYYNMKGRSHHYLDDETNYNEAIKYYTNAIKLATNLKDISVYHRNMGRSYFELGNIYRKSNQKNKQNLTKSKEYFEKTIELYNTATKILRENNYGLKSGYFNKIGMSYDYIGYEQRSKKLQHEYCIKGIEAYSKAIEIDSKITTYYWNRGLSYTDIKEYKKSLKDFMDAVFLSSKDKKFIDEIINILNENINLSDYALNYYNEKFNSIENRKLKNKLEEYVSKLNNNSSKDENLDSEK